jgi:nitroreductase
MPDKTPALDTVFPLPSPKPEVTRFLKERRSNLAKFMSEPGPSRADLAEILEISARVPDHRKLSPWRFLVFEGKSRETLGQHIASAFIADNPQLPLDRSVFESGRLLRAPTVIAVISSPVVCPRGTPEWEQILCAGAVCYNMLLAAQAQGFGAQWLTEWFAYDSRIQSVMGLKSQEKIAGFLYLGTALQPARERVRPDLSALIQYW